jgi:ABC-type anion transport system duplicated permease subunit
MHAQLHEFKRIRVDEVGLGHDPECAADLALTTIVRAYNELYWRRVYEVARGIGE